MINYRDKLEQSVSLIPAAAALGAEDRAALVNSLETLLQTLSRKHADIFESPTVKQCLDVLKEIQGQQKELEIKFYEDRAALKAKQKLYKEEGHDFWLYAMKSNEVLSVEITDRDEGALKYLKDINLSTIDNPKRLKLEFFFHRNTYFTNPVLVKTYRTIGDDKPIIEKAIGMEIQWCPGKRLTENCHSFFNFFEPPLVLDDDNSAEEVQSRMQQDYDIFSSIRDNIIPPGHQQKKSKGLLAPYDFRKLEKQLEKIFLRERAALEAKYQKLYEPLYNKRDEIVNGIIEVRGGKKEAATDPKGDKATKEKGVPYFWFTAMKNDEVLAQEITEHDEDALKYLKDIKWSRINNAKGFMLEFLFDPNPYFENSVLTKTYRVTREYGNHFMVKKAIGTKIKWHPGKSLMNTLLKKKPRKRSKNAKSMTNTGHRQSFFNFFNPFHPPELPYMPYHEDGSHDMYKDLEQEFECRVELDYAIGKIIRDKVIPHAISLFSGEAVEQVAEYEDLDDDDDLYDDDDDDDDDDDESDDDNGDDDDHNGDDEDDHNGDDEDDYNDGDLDDED